MIIPKELYIDPFSFKSTRSFNNLESYVCDFLNENIEEIIIFSNFSGENLIGFIHKENGISTEASIISFTTKQIYLNKTYFQNGFRKHFDKRKIIPTFNKLLKTNITKILN